MYHTNVIETHYMSILSKKLSEFLPEKLSYKKQTYTGKQFF